MSSDRPANELPAFARMSMAVAHAPSLFQALPKTGKIEYLELRYDVGPLSYRLVGPQLGTTELRVLQALVAIATGRQAWNDPGAVVVSSPLDKVAWLLNQSARITTSYNEIARAAGYAANSGAMTRRIRKALERMYGVQVFVAVVGSPKDFEAGRLFTQLNGRDDGLCVGMCPVLAAAILGTPGGYLRLDMTEVRRLESDAARLLHQRLHWINAGECREVSIDVLCGYIWPEATGNGSTRRGRRRHLRKALDELSLRIGWRCFEVRPGMISIHRPLPVRTITGRQSERQRHAVRTPTRPRQDANASTASLGG